MKTFKDFIKENKDQMRKFVFDMLRDDKLDSDMVRQSFIKKYGKGKLKEYEELVDEFMGS